MHPRYPLRNHQQLQLRDEMYSNTDPQIGVSDQVTQHFHHSSEAPGPLSIVNTELGPSIHAPTTKPDIPYAPTEASAEESLAPDITSGQCGKPMVARTPSNSSSSHVDLSSFDVPRNGSNRAMDLECSPTQETQRTEFAYSNHIDQNRSSRSSTLLSHPSLETGIQRVPLAPLYKDFLRICVSAARRFYLKHVDSTFAPSPMAHEREGFAAPGTIAKAHKGELSLATYLRLLTQLNWRRICSSDNAGCMETVQRVGNICLWGAKVVDAVRQMPPDMIGIVEEMEQGFAREDFGGVDVLVDTNHWSMYRAATSLLEWLLCKDGVVEVEGQYQRWFQLEARIEGWR